MGRAVRGPSRSGRRRVVFRRLAPALWSDLERLFGPRGACAGCWCMWWRLRRPEWQRGQGSGNKRAFRRLVEEGKAKGILAYVDGDVAGWCGLGPRGDFGALGRSRVLAPVDDRPVWSIVCLFILPSHRKHGLSVRLLREAARLARGQGARLLEGYPIEPPGGGDYPPAFAATGIASAFRRAGFVERARRSPTRPIMRRALSRRRTSP